MLEIDGLTVAFGEKVVLQDLNLRCQPNTVHGILGFNGAGKTTLFRTIYGFKKRDKGRCYFQGRKVRAEDIAFMETDTFFYDYMRGREYLELLSMHRTDFAIDRWNAVFELPLDTLIDTYSTGMKKKLAFLGLLALDRPIWILDEPFSGVDVEGNEQIFQILQRVKQDRTILISSHILASFTTVCDQISVLKSGGIAGTYTREQFPELENSLRLEIQDRIGDALDGLV